MRISKIVSTVLKILPGLYRESVGGAKIGEYRQVGHESQIIPGLEVNHVQEI